MISYRHTHSKIGRPSTALMYPAFYMLCFNPIFFKILNVASIASPSFLTPVHYVECVHSMQLSAQIFVCLLKTRSPIQMPRMSPDSSLYGVFLSGLGRFWQHNYLRVESKVFQRFNSLNHASKLDSLVPRYGVGSLSLWHRYYFGFSSWELPGCMLPPLARPTSTRIITVWRLAIQGWAIVMFLFLTKLFIFSCLLSSYNLPPF